jgi:hypothetical protein
VPVSRLAVGELWRSTSYADTVDHRIAEYLKRLASKFTSVEVTYNQREQYVSNGPKAPSSN